MTGRAMSSLVFRMVVTAITCVRAAGAGAQAPSGDARATARAAAPIDLTGQWVAVISEDWRWRMMAPPKGDIVSIPLNLEGQHVAEAWNPAKDEAAGEQCKAYGAPGLMRGPIRMRISWLDENTLRLETDYGMQTRQIRFEQPPARPGPRSWQGVTTGEWTVRGGRGAPRFGTLKTITTNLRPGYLRKNGVPYSERAVFTEYWDVHTLPNGDRLLVDTNVVEDPVYLQLPFETAVHYTIDHNASKWEPTPCDARF